MEKHSTENSEKLQSCTESYSCKQKAGEINKIFRSILSNFVHFIDERFQFNFFRRIQTPVQNFDFGLFEFEFEFKFKKIQYCSYL